MVDYLRPGADSSSGSWTDEGASGTNIYQSINEASASDSDYGQSSDNPASDSWTVALSNPTAGVDTAEDVIIRYRYGRDDAVGNIDLDVELVEGATTIASAAHEDISDTPATATITLDAGEKSTVSDWDALALKFTAKDGYQVTGDVPDLVADFVRGYYRMGGVDTTFASLFTFARTSSATYIDSSGTVQTATSGNHRIGYHVWNGSAWVNAGLALEPTAATNLVLNSATLSTQSVTVTAEAHTLHFTGTGTITLSGASTAGPLVGTGTGENNRVSLTFTPSAGSLTLTVSGTVTNAQLEVGSIATTYIPTGGSTATRAAESIEISSSNYTISNYAAGEAVLALSGYVNYITDGSFQGKLWFMQNVSNYARRIELQLDNDDFIVYSNYNGAEGTVAMASGVTEDGLAPFNVAGSYDATSTLGGASDGTAGTATTMSSWPNSQGSIFLFKEGNGGIISSFRLWEQKTFTDAKLEAATS